MADYTASKTSNSALIASDRVEGTAVYGTDEKRLGTVQNIMIDKRSGQAEYAVMSFGGFLGIGEDHYPIPWSKLTYDTEKGGYRIDIDQKVLEEAPRYPADERPVYDSVFNTQIGAYYGF